MKFLSYKNFSATFKKIILAGICLLISGMIVITSLNVASIIASGDTVSEYYGFEKGYASDYITGAHNQSWSKPKNYSTELVTSKYHTGKQSLKITNKDASDTSVRFYLNTDNFMPDKGKFINLSILVDSSSKAPQATYLLCRRKDGSVKLSDPYYFSQNKAGDIPSANILGKDIWVNMSYEIPSDKDIDCIGIFVDGTTDETILYIDDFFISDKFCGADGEEEKPDYYGFEAGTTSDYITGAQNQSWSKPKNYSTDLVISEFHSGKQSLRILNKDASDTAIRFYLNSSKFMADKGKFINLSLMVDNASDTPTSAYLFCKRDNGTVTVSSPYYFSENTDNATVFEKGKWINLSYQLPSDKNITNLGIYLVGTTANTIVYIDDFFISDKFCDTDGKEDKPDYYGFEAGTTADYIIGAQNQSWSGPKNYSTELSTDKFRSGKQSLKILNKDASDTAIRFYLNSSNFMADKGKFINLSLMVDGNSDAPTSAYLFCKRDNGTVTVSSPYYFSENTENATVFEKDIWINLSYQLPSDKNIVNLGLYLVGTTANTIVYIDDFFVSDNVCDINGDEVSPDYYDFEAGTVADYIVGAQNQSWVKPKNYSAELTTSKFLSGKQSLKILNKDASDIAIRFYFNSANFTVDKGKYINLSVLVDNTSDAPIAANLLCKRTDGTVKVSDPIYFSQNKDNDLSPESIHDKEKWVNLSFLLPSDKDIDVLGLYLDGTTANTIVYIDKFFVSDTLCDENGNEVVPDYYEFESGGTSDYIIGAQNQSWKGPKNYSTELVTKHKSGKQSLKVSNKDDSDTAIRFYLNSERFMAEKGKYINLSILIDENSTAPTAAYLFAKRTDGTLKVSDAYYFAQNTDNSVPASSIYPKETWVNLSYKLPSDKDITNIGIYIEGTTANTIFYIDSFFVSDEFRGDDGSVETPDYYHFETGSSTDYISGAHNQEWKGPKSYTAELVKSKMFDGKRSLKITNKDAADTSIRFYFNKDNFMTEKGKYINLRILVDANSAGPVSAHLLCRRTDGTVKTGDAYYFSQNAANSVPEGSIYAKEQWINLCYLIPSDKEIEVLGLYLDGTTDNTVVYIDNFFVSDKSYDANGNEEVEDYFGYESGMTSEYISGVHKTGYKGETNFTASLVRGVSHSGNKSLHFFTDSADVEWDLVYFAKKFKPAPGKSINLWIMVPESNKGLDKVELFYRTIKGNIGISSPISFMDSASLLYEEDINAAKGTWALISFEIPSDVELDTVGIRLSSTGTNGYNKEIYIDDYSITDKPLSQSMAEFVPDKNSSNFMDFEKGCAAQYVGGAQNEKWKGMSFQSAVTSKKSYEGNRSLYLTSDTDDTIARFIFRGSIIPPTGKFVNAMVWVDDDSKGIDSVSLSYKVSTGKVSNGRVYYFTKPADTEIEESAMRQKGKWFPISMYIPKGTDIVYLSVTTVGNAGKKTLYLDNFTITSEPTDKTWEYLIKPLSELPDSLGGVGPDRVSLSSGARDNGFDLLIDKTLKTNLGNISRREITLWIEKITKGDIYDKAVSNIGKKKQISLFEMKLYRDKTEIKPQEKFKATVIVPQNIDAETAEIYYVEPDGSVKKIDSKLDFEKLTFETDKVGYFAVVGEKAKMTFNKVALASAENGTDNSLLKTVLFIAIPAVIVLGVAVTLIFILKKKKRKSK